ncbi:tetratricopeptide repeat protein [Porticoccaceae bacterium]|nr:tetratricopeptide repeat protein [Porticoccaceae bacterium]
MKDLDFLYTLYRQGKLDDVLVQSSNLLEQGVNSAEIYAIMGGAYTGLGMLETAAEHFLTALKINPDNAEIHNNVAVVLKNLGRMQEAELHGRTALELAPNYAQAFDNLGNLLKSLGRNQEALAHHNKAVELQPQSARSHNNVGNDLRALGHHEKAIPSFVRALEINPSYAEAHNNLGSALNSLGRYKEAIASYANAIAIKPNIAIFYNNIGNSYHHLGDFSDAMAAYNNAIRLNPSYAQAYRNLSEIKRYGEDDPLVKQMNDLLGSPNCSNDDLMNIRFALGKANADIGDCAQAFEHFYHGNRLRKTQLGYDISSDQALFASIKELFSHGVAALDVTPTLSDKKPIFVLGMPRSGTTLVEQILASHPLVHGAGELQLMPQLVRSANHGIISNHSDMQSIRDAYLSAVQQLAPDKPYIVDKMPYNFVWIGHILTTLPEAKIVHLKRDAVAVCWSNFKHCFSSAGNGFSYDLEDVARYYRLYEELMLFWHQQFPGRILDFSYEALTNNQADETHRLLEYVELEWDDRCIDFHATERAVATASSRQVRQKLYQGSSEEWRRYETYLRPMLNIINAN